MKPQSKKTEKNNFREAKVIRGEPDPQSRKNGKNAPDEQTAC
jgi:hypothetical protein